MTLKEYLEARLEESKKDNYAFTNEGAAILEGREAELQSLLDSISEGESVIFVCDEYGCLMRE